ncbi:TonB-denpendent receptor [Massilia sp. Root351]|uniref:TonB-dependent receptor n=1 Tax=Massilia sp. Root351 TaxID=1736522 RepID=UPI00070AD8E4|nr:TonB-dependent receptor [Massilia sp. Root351]KQV86677.1 TonB-denpendent receptor [Massilia sp. Root351]
MLKLHPIPSALAAALCSLLALPSSRADDTLMQRVLIDGSRASQLGVADAAGDGSVTQQQLAARTTYRPGELLEATPGLIVSQHSGEGKANQFYLRGFNLDHGTDLRTTVDGMPVNQRSHAHGQGWTDLNFLIPELAARLDYKKGPYSAEQGDFASAGAASIVYANRLVRGVASASAGQNGYRRALLADSLEVGPARSGAVLYALEAMHNDGPYTRGDDYHKLNAVLRYSQGYANNGFNLTAMAYSADWNATDQIPLRAVQQGLLGRYDGVDNSDGGKAQRYSLSGAWQRSGEDTAARVSAYLIANKLDLYSNFTYFMDDPVNGDQFAQPDRRVTSGVDASVAWHAHIGEASSITTAGLQLQHDNIFNGLYKTVARQAIAATRADHIVESSLGLYVENSTRWTPLLRTTAGLRADGYRFDVRPTQPGSASALAHPAARASDRLLSPSLGAVFGPWAQTELYANAGTGFHSNDARGAVVAEGAAGAPLVRSRGMELGLRSEWLPRLQSSLSVYRLDFGSELSYVGDAGATEAGEPSRRYGVEFSNYYKPFKWLSVDADIAFARARSRGAAAGAAYLPGAVEGVAQLALTLDKLGPWSGALRLRYFGPRPLTEDNSVRSRASQTLNGRIGYKFAGGLQLELEGFNLAKRRVSAIDYYYASQLKGETQPVDDVHFHPVESRSFRLMLTQSF